jgi:hypothetical protein
MISTTQTRDRPQTKSTITSADDARLHLPALTEYTKPLARRQLQ